MANPTKKRRTSKSQTIGPVPVKSLLVPVEAEGEEVRDLFDSNEVPRPRVVEQLNDLALQAWLSLQGRGESGRFEFHVTAPEPVTSIPREMLGGFAEIAQPTIERVMVGDSAEELLPMPHAFSDWHIQFQRTYISETVSTVRVEDELAFTQRVAKVAAELLDVADQFTEHGNPHKVRLVALIRDSVISAAEELTKERPRREVLKRLEAYEWLLEEQGMDSRSPVSNQLPQTPDVREAGILWRKPQNSGVSSLRFDDIITNARYYFRIRSNYDTHTYVITDNTRELWGEQDAVKVEPEGEAKGVNQLGHLLALLDSEDPSERRRAADSLAAETIELPELHQMAVSKLWSLLMDPAREVVSSAFETLHRWAETDGDLASRMASIADLFGQTHQRGTVVFPQSEDPSARRRTLSSAELDARIKDVYEKSKKNQAVQIEDLQGLLDDLIGTSKSTYAGNKLDVDMVSVIAERAPANLLFTGTIGREKRSYVNQPVVIGCESVKAASITLRTADTARAYMASTTRWPSFMASPKQPTRPVSPIHTIS